MLEGGFCLIGYTTNKKGEPRLNPYYAGRWFLLDSGCFHGLQSLVLILIMLEGGFC